MMNKSAKVLLLCIVAVSILAIYDVFAPPIPSRKLAEIELPIPPQILSVIDHDNVSMQYALAPTMEEAKQCLDADGRQYLDFLSTHLTSTGTIVLELPIVTTRSPFGRIILKESCKAVVLRTTDLNRPDEPKKAYAIQIPSTDE
jgi:hypothetical protein